MYIYILKECIFKYSYLSNPIYYAWMEYVPTNKKICVYVYRYIHKSPTNITYLCVEYTMPRHYLYTPYNLHILPTHVS